MKLAREFYLNGDVTKVARDLLGKQLMVRSNGHLAGGMIVEAEAYCGAKDRASHAFMNKITDRTKIMFQQGGVAYVYLCYGIHHLFNVVTNKENKADAVLIRAIQPTVDLDIIAERRNASRNSINLTNGPGKLSKALNIDINYNGMDLLGDRIWIEEPGEQTEKVDPSQIVATKRIGVDYAGPDADLLWRFYIKNNPWVSVY